MYDVLDVHGIDVGINCFERESSLIESYSFGIPGYKNISDSSRKRSDHARISGMQVASSLVNGIAEYYTKDDLVYVVSFRRIVPKYNWPVLAITPSFANGLSVIYSAPGNQCVDRWHNDVIKAESERTKVMQEMCQIMEEEWNATRTRTNDAVISVYPSDIMLKREIVPDGFRRVHRKRSRSDDDSIRSQIQYESAGADFVKNMLFKSKDRSSVEKVCEAFFTIKEVLFKDIDPNNAISEGMQKLCYDIERCMLVVYRIFTSETPAQVAFEFFSFAHEVYGQSITFTLHQIYCLIFDKKEDKEITPESKQEDVDNHSDFIKMIRDSAMSWERIKRNKLFEKVHFLISCAVSMQLCDASNISWTIAGVKVYQAESLSRSYTATDIISSIIDCALFFIEGGAKCFEKGSITPLFFHGGRLENFEEELVFLQTHIEDIQCGNLMKKTGMLDNEYAEKLDSADRSIETLYTMAETNAERQVLGRYRKEVKNLLSTFQTIKMNSGHRIRPFTTLLFGDTGIGKSTLTTILMRLFFQSIGIEYNEDFVGMVEECDSFMSGWKTHYLGAIVDDIGNTKEAFLDKSPLARFLHMVNMVPMSAPQAEAHLKGKVSFEALYIGVTTNIKDMRAGAMSHKPNSILSRLEVVVTPTVIKEFRIADGHMLDFAKANAWNIGKSEDERMLPPFWTLTAEKARFSTNSDNSDHHTWEVIKDSTGKPMKDVPIHEFVKWYIPYCKNYYENQKETLATSKLLNKNMKWCETCNLPALVCNCENLGDIFSVSTTSSGIDEIPDDKEENADEKSDDESDDSVASSIFQFFKPDLSRLRTTSSKKISSGIVPESLSSILGYVDCKVDFVTKTVFTSLFNKVSDSVTNSFYPFCDSSAQSATMITCAALRWAWNSPFARVTTWIPESWLFDGNGQPRSIIFEWIGSHAPRYNRFDNVLITTGGLLSTGLSLAGVYKTIRNKDYKKGALLTTLGLFSCGLTAYRCYSYRRRLASRIQRERGMLSTTVQMIRDNYVSKILEKLGWVFGAYVALKTAKTIASLYFKDVEEESLLAPKTIEEVGIRESMPNQWLRAQTVRIPGGDIPTATPEQLLEALKKNVVHVTYECSNGFTTRTGATTGLFISSNYLLMTNHTFITNIDETFKDIYLEIKISNVDNPSSIKRCMVSIVGSRQIGDNDLRLFYVHNSGDKRDITKWFPVQAPSKCVVTLLHRDATGNFINQVGEKSQEPKYHSYYDGRQFFGNEIIGNGNLQTEQGMCGSPWISSTSSPCIAGLHCGSRKIGYTSTAYCVLLLRDELIKYRKELESLPFNLRHFGPGIQPDSLYGKEIISSTEINPKSFLNWIETPVSYDVLGSSNYCVTLNSSVEKTPISDKVVELFGFENNYGPPLIKPSWKPYYITMANFATPCYGFPGHLVEKSSLDLFSQLKPLYETDIAAKRCKPLTLIESVSGKDGFKIMERINVNTSPGLPFSGSKAKFLEEAPPTEGISKPLQPTAEITAECSRIVECYRKGIKYHPVFKACIKDEAKVQPAKKARMFFACPMAFTLVLRMYFLPVFHIMSLNPLTSESAIGINCASPEWEELMNHVEQHGTDRIVGGDYKSYDQKLSSQMTRAVYSILIRCRSIRQLQ
jgi:hypothetical protein